MKNIERVIIYGSGRRCERMLEVAKHENIEIDCIIDSNPQKWGTCVKGYRISSPDLLLQKRNIPINIAIADDKAASEVRKLLCSKYKYDLANEISYEELLDNMYLNIVYEQKIFQSVERINERNRTILFDCCEGLGLGGIEAWTQNLVLELAKRGWKDIYILSPKGQYNVPCELQNYIEYFNADKAYFYDKKKIVDIARCIIRHMPCTIVTSQPNVLLFLASIVKQHFPGSVKIISVIHGGLERICDSYLVKDRYIDRYIGVSQDIEEILIGRGVKKERIAHITCPVKCDEVLKRKYTINQTEPIKIGYAGRLIVLQKRSDLLLKLIDLLEEKGINYRMEIAGDGTGRHEIEEFVKKRRIAHKVSILGALDREKMVFFWKNQDVCVNVADYEGRSISIMEAMANGAVPIVTATSGVREDITDGWNGYIVELEDYHTMAERVEWLAKNRMMIPKMGKRAHDVIYPKVQMQKHIEFWENELR